MKVLRDLSILIFIFGGIWAAGAFYVAQTTTQKADDDKSEKDDLEDFIESQINIDENIYHDDSLEKAIGIIMDRLSSTIENSKKYHVTVLKSGDINAFATVKDNIFLNTGLIKKCGNPEMLAGVLAHEIGHLEKNHLIDRLKTELGLSVILSIMAGGDPILMAEIGKTALALNFNRQQETEADDFARDLLVKSNIDPARFGQFMMVINRENQNKATIEFLNTHPNPEDRILRTAQYTKPVDFQEEPFELDWTKIIDSINAFD